MYSVTEEYIEQMMQKATRRRLTGTIGEISFTGEDLVRGSFSITGRAAEESNTKIGGVYLGQLDMIFVPSFLSKVARTEYEGKEVSVLIGLWIPDEDDLENGGEWVDVPIGIYTLQAPKISKQGVTVSGYDNLKKLDKRFQINATSATLYGFMNYISITCDVELGQTQSEINALPNGDELFGLYEQNDIETYRDLLYWVAQACGCFACAGRDGKIYLRKFGNPTGILLDEMHRDTDIVFSGYTTKWTGISIVDMETQTTKYYGLEVDDGLTMNLGANPLLQLGTNTAIDRRCRNILNAVADIQYTPFYCNSARDPIFDLGDEITFTGGLGAGCVGCVMAYEFKPNNYNFEGFGDNPALANGRSKTDKNIAGLLQNTVENEVTYYNFANLEEITFGSEREVTLAILRFTSAQTTTVKIMHEFIFDMIADLSADCSYEIRYYLDNQLLTYKPYERIGGLQGVLSGDITEGSICRDFFYILKDVEPSIMHTWEVRMIAHNIDSVTIEINNAHVVLEGQRLFSEDYFNGFIEVREDITVIPIYNLDIVDISETVSLIQRNAVFESISDNITLYNVDKMQVIQLYEGAGALRPNITFEGGLNITSENELDLTDENGNSFITE